MKIVEKYYFSLLLLGILSPSAIAQALPSVIVSSVRDGDTLRVNQAGKTITVRLGCVDAPEQSQPGGSESTQRLQQLLPPGQSVQMRQISSDRYNRTIAELYLNGRSLNLQLVQEGQVVVYRQHLNGCSSTQNQYLQAEQQARSARRGFWAQSNPVLPWKWQRNRR